MLNTILKTKKTSFRGNWRLRKCFMCEAVTEIIVPSYHHHLRHLQIRIRITEDKDLTG